VCTKQTPSEHNRHKMPTTRCFIVFSVSFHTNKRKTSPFSGAAKCIPCESHHANKVSHFAAPEINFLSLFCRKAPLFRAIHAQLHRRSTFFGVCPTFRPLTFLNGSSFDPFPVGFVTRARKRVRSARVHMCTRVNTRPRA